MSKWIEDELKDLRDDRHEKYFRGASIVTGHAVLETPSKDGSSREELTMVGVQALMWYNKFETVGLGLFLGFDFEATKDRRMDYIGFGVSLTCRIPDSGYPITFGAGYGIDRKYIESNSPIQADRTGLFIMFSSNPWSLADRTSRGTKNMIQHIFETKN